MHVAHFPDQTEADLQRCKTNTPLTLTIWRPELILLKACESALASAEAYTHTETEGWNNAIIVRTQNAVLAMRLLT